MIPRRTLQGDESGVVRALGERDLTLASALGKYRLLGGLGYGGMADVYLAVAGGPEGFRKLCVLKLLKKELAEEDEFRAMFLDEARLAARLNHPNIVQTFEVGEIHKRLMIAMEYVEGQPATRVRRRLGAEGFPLAAAISVLCDVLDALEYAHTLADFDGSPLGIVHRDVTPHNIIVGYDGRVKLLDFGIAKSASALQETQAGVLKGKVGYLAPEQGMMGMMGRLDGRADLFSVGVILWETIAGRRLSEGLSSHDTLVRRIGGHDPKIAEVAPNVNPRLAAICDRAMAPVPDDRFDTAAEFQTALERWLKESGEPSRKELSKALREAFLPEREQLRMLVEEQVGDSSPSGPRPTSSLSVGSSSEPFGEPTLSAPAPTAAAAAHAPARKEGSSRAIVGVAAIVALSVAGAVYVARSSRVHSATDAHSFTVAPLPSPADSAVAAALTTASAPATALVVDPPVSVAPERSVHLPVGRSPTGAGRATTPLATLATSTGSPTSGPAPTPTKAPSRSLDEKDPYAP